MIAWLILSHASLPADELNPSGGKRLSDLFCDDEPGRGIIITGSNMTAAQLRDLVYERMARCTLTALVGFREWIFSDKTGVCQLAYPAIHLWATFVNTRFGVCLRFAAPVYVRHWKKCARLCTRLSIFVCKHTCVCEPCGCCVSPLMCSHGIARLHAHMCALHVRTLIGFRQRVTHSHMPLIYSIPAGALGTFAAATEYAFATIQSRTMTHPGRVRMHYGHPDVFNKLFTMTRGGISKGTRQLHISEDYFIGAAHSLRGGRIRCVCVSVWLSGCLASHLVLSCVCVFVCDLQHGL